jgi:hypothetical protein
MKEFLESPNLLETVAAAAKQNNDIARELVGALSEEQLNWKPAAESWSIAQCLEHLTVASRQFDPYLTDAMARGRRKWPAETPPEYRPSFVGGWLIRYVQPESVRKVSAPKIFQPSESSKIHGALESFLKQQESFIAFVKAAGGIDYNKTRLRSPVTPFMRYSVADAFVVTVVHTRRHLGQAQRVRSNPSFPN